MRAGAFSLVRGFYEQPTNIGAPEHQRPLCERVCRDRPTCEKVLVTFLRNPEVGHSDVAELARGAVVGRRVGSESHYLE
jgi:hypothetical protein